MIFLLLLLGLFVYWQLIACLLITSCLYQALSLPSWTIPAVVGPISKPFPWSTAKQGGFAFQIFEKLDCRCTPLPTDRQKRLQLRCCHAWRKSDSPQSRKNAYGNVWHQSNAINLWIVSAVKADALLHHLVTAWQDILSTWGLQKRNPRPFSTFDNECHQKVCFLSYKHGASCCHSCVIFEKVTHLSLSIYPQPNANLNCTLFMHNQT